MIVTVMAVAVIVAVMAVAVIVAVIAVAVIGCCGWPDNDGWL